MLIYCFVNFSLYRYVFFCIVFVYKLFSRRIKMRTLTVANRKGGAGKSTCAAHISLEAVKSGLKVILIDLDPQKTLEGWWNKRKEENPYLTDAAAANLKEVLANIENKGFDLCIIDTPGDTSGNTTAAIEAADLVLIPSKPTSPDLSAMGRTIAIVKEANKNFLFAVTQAISRSNTALQAASVLSEFGPVAPSSISNRVSYANAMATGISASEIDKSAADEITLVWENIYSRLYNKPESSTKKKVI